MRIAIDCRKLNEDKTGIGNFIEYILDDLFILDDVNEYFLLLEEDIDKFSGYKNVNKIICNKFKKIFPVTSLYKPFWLNFLVPKLLKENKINFFWGPNFVKPISFPNAKSMITIHDLAFLNKSIKHSSLHSWYLKKQLDKIINNELKINTVSNYSKMDILKHYKVKDEQILITYCGIHKEQFEPLKKHNLDFIEELNERYQLPEKFMLFVGTTEYRKNLRLILEAMDKMQEKSPYLVIVGKSGGGQGELDQLIKQYNLEDKITLTGYITNNELKALYARAEIFLFPSYYEGFGIPIIESMASGTPVIASNVTSLPEICGDAALKINPSNTDELILAINKLREDTLLYHDLVEKGIKRSEMFEWKKAAQVIKGELSRYEK